MMPLLQRHFKFVAVKFLLNYLMTLTMPIFKDPVKRLGFVESYSAYHQSDIFKLLR